MNDTDAFQPASVAVADERLQLVASFCGGKAMQIRLCLPRIFSAAQLAHDFPGHIRALEEQFIPSEEKIIEGVKTVMQG